MKTFTAESAANLITEETTIFWFRRDLRLDDNSALYRALKANRLVLPLFIFDTVILDQLEDKADRRVEFILESLKILKNDLERSGSSLLILVGDPIRIFKKIRPKAVYANHDYEPYARERDGAISRDLMSRKIEFKTYKDQVIFEKNEVVKEDGSPYTIFTPYSKKWKSKLDPFYVRSYSTKKYLKNLAPTTSLPFPASADIGFTGTHSIFPDQKIKASIIANYHNTRNFPAIEGTSRLSVHLRFGTISIRKLAQLALKKNEAWLNELIWRDFYQMILWHFPNVVTRSFKPAYDRIAWRNNADEFDAWCEGRTGYPIVDAGMRELNQTGFMHNRVRMIVASFLTKHLLIDWRWGEAYFARKLLDYDLAANNGGWQWAASSGCDAVPYFRVFNPELQAEKFDPNQVYIKNWVPEFGTAMYPKPVVDHKKARERALLAYGKALEK